MTKSGFVINFLLERIAQDPRLAYHFDPLTLSMERMTEAVAEELGENVEEFRKRYYARLGFEPPKCAKCRADVER